MSADPFAFVGMSDAQVIELAATHLQRAARLPSGSQRRAIEWAKFTDAYDEYARREDERVQRMLARYLRPDPHAPAARTRSPSLLSPDGNNHSLRGCACAEPGDQARPRPPSSARDSGPR